MHNVLVHTILQTPCKCGFTKFHKKKFHTFNVDLSKTNVMVHFSLETHCDSVKDL